MTHYVSILLWITGITTVLAGEMRTVSAGMFTPFYTNDGPVEVKAFMLDVYPVTNGEYLDFVRNHPEWSRSLVPKLFADERYLQHWESDFTPGTQAPLDSPVTLVSWHAARAYAAWKGKRLPSLPEWEFAGRAEPANAKAGDASLASRLLAWYARRSQLPLPAVGNTFANAFGIWDMHGLIWEWVEDFNSVPVSSRADSADDPSSRNFCGGAAIGIDDVNNYAAFMRYAFRSSLSARYTVATLGFRCAKDIDDDQQQP